MNLERIINTDIEFIDGDRGQNYPSKSDFFANEYCVFLNTGNITKNGFDFSKLDFITEEKDKSLRKGKVKIDDIILTTRGTVGNVALVTESIKYPNMRINSGMVIIRSKKDFTPLFLNIFFRSELFKKQALTNGSGSAQPQLPISALKNISIPKLDKKTQAKITSVLSALDEKIALNNQINATLEQMAKTLYDYWFVQFDFPDDNGKPYKSSGGEMVYNETLKRDIPKGWEVKKLSEIAKTGSGGTPKSTVKEYYQDGTIPWINSGEVNNSIIVQTSNFITGLGLKESSAKLFPKNTILLAMYGATAGKASLLTFEATTNQAICAIMPNDEKYLIFLKTKLEQMYNYLVNLSSGSARDNLSQDKIKELQISIPTDELLEKFHLATRTMYEKIIVNSKENSELIKLRDWLLPMLMNGQVTVQ